jgi:glycosyltransferase involved in cell wall biosynthesis
LDQEAKELSVLKPDISWVIFGSGSKPTSFRRILAEYLDKSSSVILVTESVSALRRPHLLISERRISLPGQVKEYRPLHTPERILGLRRFLQSLNHKRFLREIGSFWQKPPAVVCYDSPTQYLLVKELGEKLSIYLAVDDRTLTVEGEGIPGELEAEKILLGRVDMVICISEALADRLRTRIPSGSTLRVHALPNGYDKKIFNTEREYPEPPFLVGVPRPRILVAGHISERIDWDGLSSVTRARPKWRWVFLGPADQGMKERIARIFAKRGFYHAPVLVSNVPAWISHCDASAVPYRLNPFTLASHPLKAMEYLAMGKPLLSTRVPSLECYDGVVEWVEEGVGQSYAQALDRILRHDGNPEMETMRMRAVANDSWDARVDQFSKVVLEGLNSVDKSKFQLGPRDGP